MILSDADIKRAINEQKIIIEPPPLEDQFDSSSLDLRLGDEFKEWNQELVKKQGAAIHIDFSDFSFKASSASFLRDLPKESDGSVLIKPQAFVLATTLEKITLKREGGIAARIEGRSSVARLGLVVHLSAPTIQLGWSGNITLEIINFGPFHVRLDPKKDRISQLIFEQVLSPSSGDAGSGFRGQSSVTGV